MDKKELLVEIINKAGKILMDYYGHTTILSNKDNSVAIVTEADLASEKYIKQKISENFPTHGFIAEESDAENIGAEFVWHIDPLDGTKNFQSGVPLFGVNIALTQNGIPILAAINLPATNEIVVAELNQGVELITPTARRKLECSQKVTWDGIYGIGPVKHSEKHLKFFAQIDQMANKSAWINGIASPAVSAVWLADARRDFYISTGSNSWDFTAPYLVAKESGLHVSNFAGAEWRPGDKGIVISNKYFHDSLINFVKSAYEV